MLAKLSVGYPNHDSSTHVIFSTQLFCSREIVEEQSQSNFDLFDSAEAKTVQQFLFLQKIILGPFHKRKRIYLKNHRAGRLIYLLAEMWTRHV